MKVLLTPPDRRTYRNGDGRSASGALAPFAFHREMDQLVDDVLDGFGFTRGHVRFATWPAVEVHEHEKELVLTADLPGLEQKDIEIAFRDGILTLKGERKDEAVTSLYRERWAGAFEREVTVGSDVDADQISATLKNGVLTIRLPRKPDRQPRRIAVE